MIPLAAPVPTIVKVSATVGAGKPGIPPVGDVTVKVIPFEPSPGAAQIGVTKGVVTFSNSVTLTGVP